MNTAARRQRSRHTQPSETPLRAGSTRSLAGLLLVCSLAACGGSQAPAAEVQSYVVEGEVLYLPTAASPAITIRHQAIDDFVDMDGEVVGMDAMTMPFPLAEGLSVDGIESGDPVRFTLEVEWEGDPPYRIAKIEELPAGQ